MEIKGGTPDPSPPSPDALSLPLPAAETGPPAPASRPDGAPRPPAPRDRGPADGAARGTAAGPRRSDEKADRGGSVPEVVITQADEGFRAAGMQAGGAEDPGLLEGAASVNTSSDQTNGGDPTCCDLQSLKSDSISLASEATNSGKSLFQRLQLDPLERDWLRSAAVGDATALSRLLSQDPTLASKKTALHWAAKQGRLEMADMMARAGADVNVKSHGYTALHLAALHAHPHIIQLLLNTYNAKENIRDYHGKTPMHYWSGSSDVFNRSGSQSCGKWTRGRRTQRYAHLPSLLLSSRPRSQGRLDLEPTTMPAQPPAF